MTQPSAPFRLTICGLDELPELAGAGVTHVISILDPGYPDPPVFKSYDPHSRIVLRFDDVIADGEGYSAPTPDDVSGILSVGEQLIAQPVDHLLIHCHAGVSRSTATAALLLAQRDPDDAGAVFQTIRAVRPRSWPNSRIVRMGDAQLGLGGRLVDGMTEHHAAVAEAFPDLAAMLRLGMRAHEVPALRPRRA